MHVSERASGRARAELNKFLADAADVIAVSCEPRAPLNKLKIG